MNREELVKRIEAFKQELLVKEALINEFYKRFGKHDSYMVKNMRGAWAEFKNPTFSFTSDTKTFDIWDDGGYITVFKDGKWAEVKANGK
jgi:hypothetical protein